MNKWFEVVALVSGLSALFVEVFFLALEWGKPVWFTEPIIWIRIPEIILALFSCPILIKLTIERLNKK